MNDEINSSGPAKTSRKNRRLAVVLWGLLIVLMALAAWQGYVYFSSPSDRFTPAIPDVGAHPGDLSRSPYASAPSTGPAGPGSVLSDEGRQALMADPLGIAPPAGAARTGGFQRPHGRDLHQLATYSFRGEESAVADHYRQAFAARGYQVLKDAPGRDGLRTLVFWHNAAPRAVLTLQTRSAAAKIVEFTLTVIAPAQP